MTPTVHASAVALGEQAVLVRGASGAGKSTLVQALLAHWRADGRFARLIADDRTALHEAGGRLLASAPPPIAGSVEVRGLGILPTPFLAAARLTLVVDLLEEEACLRLPDEAQRRTALGGVTLPRIVLPARCTGVGVLAIAALLQADGLTAPAGDPQRPPDIARPPAGPAEGDGR